MYARVERVKDEAPDSIIPGYRLQRFKGIGNRCFGSGRLEQCQLLCRSEKTDQVIGLVLWKETQGEDLNRYTGRNYIFAHVLRQGSQLIFDGDRLGLSRMNYSEVHFFPGVMSPYGGEELIYGDAGAELSACYSFLIPFVMTVFVC